MTGAKRMFLWRPPASSIATFARAGLDAIARRLEGLGPLETTVHATLREPAGRSLVPFARRPIALASMRGPEALLDAAGRSLSELPGQLEGWDVDESVPVPGAAGSRTTLLTLFSRRPGLDDETFRHRWFEEHTPLTLEIHPVVGYVRNVVTRVAVPGSRAWDGIVTEDFREERDLTSLRLFGRGPRAVVNALRIAWHVRTFLDLATLETYLVEERSLR